MLNFPHRRLSFAALVILALVSPARAQQSDPSDPGPRPPRAVTMAGPRFGITMLSQGNIDELKRRRINLRPLISQFGWQFEKRVYTKQNGVTMLSEWVPLISGLDQGVALPSLNWLAGIRTPTGHEFGIGPNLSAAGVGLVIAAGVTVRTGALNIPMNVAVATSRYGPRLTFLTGFNVRTK